MNEIDIIDTFFDDKDISKISKLSVPLRSFILETCKLIINNPDNYSDVDSQTASLILNHGSCVARSNTKLKEYQHKAADYIMRPNINSLLLYFDTGTGKTLTALTISQCFLDENPKSNIIVISPSKLKHNFEKEVKSYGGVLSENYRFFSFTGFLNAYKENSLPDSKDCLLIIDEVHNLRNYLSHTYEAVMEFALKSKKRLLLTATPIVNQGSDLISIINLLEGKYIVGIESRKPRKNIYGEVYKVYNDENIIHRFKISTIRNADERIKISISEMNRVKYLLKGRIMRIKKGKSVNFPSYDMHNIFIDMSPQYEKKYNKLLIDPLIMDEVFTSVEDPHAFYNVVRRAVNKAGDEYYSEKIDFILPKIDVDRTIIYTNWDEFGSKIIRDVLSKYKIKFDVIDSKTKSKDVKKIVDSYNLGKINVLVITKAGSEGIDLKETRNVIVLDPVWNPSGLEQIIGRAVRYNSHINLPEDQRHVNIFLLILKEPNKNLSESQSGDVILYKIIQRKKKLIDEFEKIVNDINIYI